MPQRSHVPQPTLAGARRVSIVIPCLNESENIEECVRRAFAALADNGLEGEVIVVDNGS
jgi:glycosyltransferase involved in cell wall biosynthesis